MIINPIQQSLTPQQSPHKGITQSEMKAFADQQERRERVNGQIGPLQVAQQSMQSLPPSPTPSSAAYVAPSTSHSDNSGPPSFFIQICRILTIAFIFALFSVGSSLSSTKSLKKYEEDATVKKNLATHIGMGIFFIILSSIISFVFLFTMRKKGRDVEGRVVSSTTTSTVTTQGGEVIQVVQTTTADPDYPSRRNGERIGGCTCYCTCCIGYTVFVTILVLIVYSIAPPTGLYITEQQGTTQGSTRY